MRFERRSDSDSRRATKPRWTSPSTERDIAGSDIERPRRDVRDGHVVVLVEQEQRLQLREGQPDVAEHAEHVR